MVVTMNTGTNKEIMIIATKNEAATKIGGKTKKSKKKNKVSNLITNNVDTESTISVVPADKTVIQVSNDLQDRLKLTEAEDSGFGEANGHEDSSVIKAMECAQPTTVVRSAPEDSETIENPNVSKSCETTKNCQEKGSTDASVDGVSDATKPNESSIAYVSYQNELQMPDIMRLIQKDLSEPYSIYTYRYFIHNWPKLCFLAMHEDSCVGAIVCKLDIHRQNTKRGYIAMLAVDKEYRKLKIGTNLVQNAIQAMLAYNADEVVLETEITNIPALRLYENLGFVRDKRLFGYYLNGVDALRLKLWFR